MSFNPGARLMDAIKVIGQVDQHHQLVATVPDSVAPGPVEVVIIPHTVAEDDTGQNWTAGIAAEWHEELADARQDIYSLSDGVAVDDAR